VARLSYSASSYPYDTVVRITDTIGGKNYQASGVLISPDEVLTASHVVYMQGVGTASDVVVTPGYSDGSSPYGSANGIFIQYNAVDDATGFITNSQSQYDYAIITLATSFTSVGYMGIEPNFGGGSVNITGYPASAGGAQIDSIQSVTRNPNYSLLDGTALGDGSSGGPLWIETASGPEVVGLVSSESDSSTTGYNVLITASVLNQIQAWLAQDNGTSIPPGATPTPTPTPASATDIVNHVTGTNFLGGAVPGFLLVNSVPGSNVETLLAVGANGSTSLIGVFGTGWEVDAGGDAFGPGQADIFLKQDANGVRNLFVAETNGNQIGAVDSIGAVGEGWQVAGSGDFDGNGYSGLLLQQDLLGLRTLQFLPVQNGSSSAPVTTAVLPDSWQIDAIGPLTANPNQDDILMSYVNTAGQLNVEQLNLANGVSTSPRQIGAFGAGWQVDGIGTFNGNGNPEILLEDDVGSTRYLFAATLANGSIASEFLLGAVGDNVQIAGIGKFNGDRTSDIAFNYNNSQTGQNTLGFYQVENNAIVRTYLSGATGPSWNVS
jgi:V8-like Glu-specific endopeptidase